MKKIIFCMLAVATASSVSAQSLYVGGSIGISQNKLYNDPNLTAGGYTRTDDKTDFAFKGLVGYNIDKTFAIEASYTDLGSNKVVTTDGVDTVNSKNSAKAATLAGKVNITKFDKVTPFVKLGVTRLTTKETGFETPYKNSKTNLYWAVGGDYDLNKTVSLRAEYENYGKVGSFDEVSINNNATGVKSSALTLGVIYKF